MIYLQEALKTESKPDGDMLLRASGALRLLHGAMGLVTEAIEFQFAYAARDLTNQKEELGDGEWYMAVLRNAHDDSDDTDWVLTQDWGDWTYEFPFGTFLLRNVDSRALVDGYVHVAGDLLDLVKKHIFYGKGIGIAFYAKMAEVNVFLCAIYQMLGIDREEVRRMNLDKLQKVRYKGAAYSHDAAINRDLDAERAGLEQYVPEGHHIQEDADGERFVKNETMVAGGAGGSGSCSGGVGGSSGGSDAGGCHEPVMQGYGYDGRDVPCNEESLSEEEQLQRHLDAHTRAITLNDWYFLRGSIKATGKEYLSQKKDIPPFLPALADKVDLIIAEAERVDRKKNTKAAYAAMQTQGVDDGFL